MKPQLGEIKRARELGKKGCPSSKYVWAACETCGKERWVQLLRGNPKSNCCLSCGTKGEKSYRWAGGRLKTVEGYILIWVSRNDFFAPMRNNHSYIFEHRLVMARHLGRCLHRWEIVHHKGIRYKGIKNRSDNLIDNLQLVSDDRHKQISILEQRIKYLEERVTLLEVENIALHKTEEARCQSPIIWTM